MTSVELNFAWFYERAKVQLGTSPYSTDIIRAIKELSEECGCTVEIKVVDSIYKYFLECSKEEDLLAFALKYPNAIRAYRKAQ